MCLGATKEVEHKNIYHRRYGGEYGRQNYGGHKQPHRDVEGGEYDEEENEDICAFAVDFHVLNIFQRRGVGSAPEKIMVID